MSRTRVLQWAASLGLVWGCQGCFENNDYQAEACYEALRTDAWVPSCRPASMASSALSNPIACDSIKSVDDGPQVPEGGVDEAGVTCCYFVTKVPAQFCYGP